MVLTDYCLYPGFARPAHRPRLDRQVGDHLPPAQHVARTRRLGPSRSDVARPVQEEHAERARCAGGSQHARRQRRVDRLGRGCRRVEGQGRPARCVSCPDLRPVRFSADMPATLLPYTAESGAVIDCASIVICTGTFLGGECVLPRAPQQRTTCCAGRLSLTLTLRWPPGSTSARRPTLPAD
jgi:hypothetical protein